MYDAERLARLGIMGDLLKPPGPSQYYCIERLKGVFDSPPIMPRNSPDVSFFRRDQLIEYITEHCGTYSRACMRAPRHCTLTKLYFHFLSH